MSDGDRVAFTRLYHLTRAALFATVRAVLVDYAMAEEVTQDVYTQVWTGVAARYDSSRGSALAYLKVVARRRAVERVRQVEGSRRRDTALRMTSPPRQPTGWEELSLTRIDLERLIKSQSPWAYEILALYYRFDQTYDQIAVLLGLPIGTVKSRHHRALRALRAVVAA